jgi:protein SCO1/2
MILRTLKFLPPLLFCLLALSCKQPVDWHGNDIGGVMPDLEFTLVGSDGVMIDAQSLRGKPVILFFGFTNCPDVCPTTLAQLAIARDKLGSLANNIRIVLVSVDPDRDTPEAMQRYTTSFGPWLLGLTGPEKTLERLRKSYGVYAAMESSGQQGSYNVMHSTAVFGFDAKGHARVLITDTADIDAVASDLDKLINE